MAGIERFEDSIGKWLEETAPGRLPERVLEATFERTRRTRQGAPWRVALRRPQVPRSLPVLGGAAALIVLAAAMLALSFGLIGGTSGPSTPSPAASPSATPGESATSGSMWPQSTVEEVQAAQRLVDARDTRYVWQVDANLSSYLSQGGPYRAAIFTRFLEEKLGWQKFQWTLGDGAYEGRVVFLRCADVVDRCDPTIDGSHYETVQVNVAQLARQGPFGIWVVTDWEMLEPFERLADPEEVFRLLNGFIDARVTGAGAQQYLNVPESGVPLLYATSSGASYEHGESTRVLGDWPYDWTPFKVQLFAGSTVVEQLVFVSRDGGHLSLEYVSDGFGTDIAPTTENGRPVAAPYNAFRDKAILYVSHPWVSRYGKLTIRLIPEGAAPTTDGGERNDWDRLVLIADPTRSGSGCPTGPGPADAEALAESIRSDPGLVATAPVAISTGRAPGVWMDVRLAEQASGVCGGLSGLTELQVSESVDLTSGLRMRLWLFDLPEASSMQIMAVAMVVPESHFERAAAAAASLSVDFSAN